MDILYTISHDYLGFLEEIADRFDFCIQGYDYFSSAIQGLLKVNHSHIMGFLIVTETFEDDLKPMVQFFRILSNMNTDIPVLIAHNDEYFEDFTDAIQENNIDISKVNLYIMKLDEVVTDTYVKEKLFYPFIASTYLPYEQGMSRDEVSYKTLYKTKKGYRLKIKDEEPITCYHNYFELSALVDKITELTLQEFRVESSLELTAYYDENLELIRDYKDMQYIRLYMMSIACNDGTSMRKYKRMIEDIVRDETNMERKIKLKSITLAAYKRGLELRKKVRSK